MPPRFSFRPLTPERFPDLERLFGPNGACAGCWCMWWRLSRAEFKAGRGETNRRALRALVRAGAAPGLLAYAGREPVGWIAFEPRAAYRRLAAPRSPALRAVDDLPVWSVTCHYVARAWRGQGLAAALLGAAARHAFRRGAPALEAYPAAPRGRAAAGALYTGVLSTYRRAGFEVVARPSPARAIVRRARPGRRTSVSRAPPARRARRPPRSPAAPAARVDNGG